MKPVIVTLTTLPKRLNDPSETFGIRPGLKTILQQSDVEYEVHLNIPYKHRAENIVVPEWLRDWQCTYKHLKLFRCKDHGPLTKIYPTLKRISDPEQIIITVDDDLFYVDGFIKSHLLAREQYPHHALGYAGITSIDEARKADSRGVHPTGNLHFVASAETDTRVRILEGYKTISYSRKFFDDSFDEFIPQHWNDDIIISAYLGYKEIKKIVLKCSDCDGDYTPRVESYPVISHTPISGDVHGCNQFRADGSIKEKTAKTEAMWYKLGYLER